MQPVKNFYSRILFTVLPTPASTVVLLPINGTERRNQNLFRGESVYNLTFYIEVCILTTIQHNCFIQYRIVSIYKKRQICIPG